MTLLFFPLLSLHGYRCESQNVKVMMMMMMNLSDIRIIFQLVFGDVGYLSVHPWTFIVPMCKISAHVQNFVAIPNKSHISTMISFQLC